MLETNSSPLKIGRAPKGTVMGQPVSFREGAFLMGNFLLCQEPAGSPGGTVREAELIFSSRLDGLEIQPKRIELYECLYGIIHYLLAGAISFRISSRNVLEFIFEGNKSILRSLCVFFCGDLQVLRGVVLDGGRARDCYIKAHQGRLFVF